MEMTQGFIDQVCNQFIARKERALQEKPIDNSQLPAGSAMYYYCDHCHSISDVVPEGWLFLPRYICSQCEGLDKASILEEAKKRYSHARTHREAKIPIDTKMEYVRGDEQGCDDCWRACVTLDSGEVLLAVGKTTKEAQDKMQERLDEHARYEALPPIAKLKEIAAKKHILSNDVEKAIRLIYGLLDKHADTFRFPQ